RRYRRHPRREVSGAHCHPALLPRPLGSAPQALRRTGGAGRGAGDVIQRSWPEAAAATAPAGPDRLGAPIDISMVVRPGTPEWPGDTPYSCRWSWDMAAGASVQVSAISM